MKRNLPIIVSACAVSVLAFVAPAQYPISPELDQSDHARDRPSHSRADRLNGAAKASDLIGMTVNNYQGEKLGKVEDLAVDVESGRIVQVILSIGGFIGMGDTLTAVPPGTLHHDVAQNVLHLNADKARLKGAPQFDNAKWDECTESNRLAEVYAYYGEQPYFVASRYGPELTSQDLKHALSLPRNMDGTINTDGKSTVEKVRNTELVHRLAENYNMRSTRNPDGTWTREYYPNGHGANASWASLGCIQRASKVIGMAVKNRQDEKLGDVENIMMDLPAGRIVAVIVSAGGFFGMSDELSAIPPTAFRLNAEQDALQLDASRETLSNAPHFKANQWPDFNQPSYAGGVYRAYQIEPYFDTTPDADNTRRNIRDRDNRTLTPLTQGNSKADVATTAQIRNEIIAGKNLSVNAQNVKIITKDGQVTLRGPVNTAAEKRRIGEIAERSIHSGKVDNQLEVKSTIGND